MDIRKCSSPRGCLGSEQAPQEMVTTPRLPELQELLGNALRDAMGEIVGVSVQSQDSDSMFLVSSFQVRIFHDSP